MLEQLKERLFRFLEDNRGFVILFFCLPASFLFDLVLRVRHGIYQALRSAPELHDTRVQAIQKRVAQWNKKDPATRKKLVTARPNWLSLSTTFFRKDLCEKIPINLYDILSLDEKNMRVRVEPMVTVGDITKFLIPKGYTLAVTLEIADATLGGLALGTGMTTHSHKVGLYHETIHAFEVVLSDGSLVRATENEHTELYRTLPWSHGSLGFLVALEINIIPVKPFVHMTYLPLSGQQNYCDKMRELSGANNKDAVLPDFLEATVFNKEEAVVMVGNFADQKEFPNLSVNSVGTWYKPWFYKYVESFLKLGNGNKYEELIPLREYLLRHNRSIFWVVEDMIPFGNDLLFRIPFGWLLPPKVAFLKFTTTPGVRELTFTKQVFQDIVLPLAKLEDQINTSEKLFDLYPLLVYACRVYDHGESSGQIKRPKPEYLCPGTNYAMYNDLGVYGVPGFVKEKKPYDPVYAMRAMEKFTRDVGGFSFLYADIFMDEKEFNEMFDLSLYEKVRKKYSAVGAFPSLYDKVKPEIDVFKFAKGK